MYINASKMNNQWWFRQSQEADKYAVLAKCSVSECSSTWCVY